MTLSSHQLMVLKELMALSAEKGNLANAGIVLEHGILLASSESLVVTNSDATAHSERMLVTEVCQQRKSNYTPGLTMITVVEPCLMCMSACSQAGYKEIGYIIPASRYIKDIPWITDTSKTDKLRVAANFSSPLLLTRLELYEEEFCAIFEKSMKKFLTVTD